MAALVLPVLETPRAGLLFVAGFVLAGAVAGALVLRAGHRGAPRGDRRRDHAPRPPALARVLGERPLPRRAGGDDGLRRPLPARRARLLDRRRRRPSSRSARALAAALRIGVGHWSDVLGTRVRPLRAIGVAVAIALALVAVLSDSPLLAARAGARRSRPGCRWRGTGSRTRSPPSSAAVAAAPRSGSSRRCSRRSASRPRSRSRRWCPAPPGRSRSRSRPSSRSPARGCSVRLAV